MSSDESVPLSTYTGYRFGFLAFFEPNTMLLLLRDLCSLETGNHVVTCKFFSGKLCLPGATDDVSPWRPLWPRRECVCVCREIQVRLRQGPRLWPPLCVLVSVLCGVLHPETVPPTVASLSLAWSCPFNARLLKFPSWGASLEGKAGSGTRPRSVRHSSLWRPRVQRKGANR